jgi:hypothetical protein
MAFFAKNQINTWLAMGIDKQTDQYKYHSDRNASAKVSNAERGSCKHNNHCPRLRKGQNPADQS